MNLEKNYFKIHHISNSLNRYSTKCHCQKTADYGPALPLFTVRFVALQKMKRRGNVAPR